MAKGKGSGTHHVVPSAGGGWDIRRGGADRASAHFERKSDAVERAREISNARTELKIHNQDGRIGQSDSHGNDPRNIKG